MNMPFLLFRILKNLSYLRDATPSSLVDLQPCFRGNLLPPPPQSSIIPLIMEAADVLKRYYTSTGLYGAISKVYASCSLKTRRKGN